MNRQPQIFKDIEASELTVEAKKYFDAGWRFSQMCASTVGNTIEIITSFSKDPEYENIVIFAKQGDTLQSISDIFLESFVYENEIHDLYGVNFENMAIDFGGTFYIVTEESPMFTPKPEEAEEEKPKKEKANSDNAVEGGQNEQ